MTTIIGYVIVAAWAISFLADLINRDYDPPAPVHALMLLVAGAAFGRTGISEVVARIAAREKEPNGK